VFIVGYLGAPCPATILFEPEGSGRDPETGQKTWPRVAPTLESGVNRTGGTRPPGSTVDTAESLVATLNSGGNAGGFRTEPGEHLVAFESRFARNGRGAPESIVPPLKAESGQTGKGDASPLLCAPTYPSGVRDSARLPLGLDSARYRALGNAVTVSVAYWIAERIVAYETKTS
jgi:site-specific DNA-cytosine methylase